MRSVLQCGILFLVAVSTTAGEPVGNFISCLRKGQSCTNGQCGVDGVSCDCQDGYTQIQGYGCVPDAMAISQCSADSCQNGGQCLNDTDSDFGGGDVCFCTQNYAGPLCDRERFQVACTENGMDITVRPFGEFAGKVYAKNHEGDAACNLDQSANKEVDSAWPYYVVNKSIPLGNCGMASASLVDGSVQYQVELMVQYSLSQPTMIVATDQSLLARCTFAPNATLSQGATVDKPVEGGGTPGGGNSTQVLSTVALQIMTTNSSGGNDVPVSANDEMMVGKPLNLDLYFTKNNVFRGFKIHRCTANNGRAPDHADYAEISVVENGCPVNNVISRGPLRRVEEIAGIRMDIPVSAVVFSKGSVNRRNSLNFKVVLKFCSSQVPEAMCVQPDEATCNQTVIGRKRRQATDSTVSYTVERAIQVYFDDSQVVDRTGVKSSQKITDECLEKNTPMQSIVGVLGALDGLALVTCLTLAYLIFKKQRKRRNKSEN